MEQQSFRLPVITGEYLDFFSFHFFFFWTDQFILVYFARLFLPQPGDVDLPGVHSTKRGQGWGEIQLEPLALQSSGGHQAGGPRLLPSLTYQGEAQPAAGPVRAGSVQPGQLQSSPQPTVVSFPKKTQLSCQHVCRLVVCLFS